MAAITKLPEQPVIMTLDDFKKLSSLQDAKIVMLAVTPAELKQIMKWVDSGWRGVLRRREYNGKMSGSTEIEERVKRPEIKIMAVA